MAVKDTIEASNSRAYKEGVADLETKYLSKITTPAGDNVYIKDALARQEIANIKELIDGGTHFLGVTDTDISDGSTTASVHIIPDDKMVTAAKGDFVIKSVGSF